MTDFDDLLGVGSPPMAPTRDVMRADDLGALLGVSGRTVRELAQKGIITKEGHGFAMADAVRAYCAHLREQAAGRSGSPNLIKERIRLAREQADALQMKNAVSRAEMVPAREVEAAWASVLRDVRSALLALPSRIQQQLAHLTAHDVSEIDREIRRTLEETANDL